jgi:hypothetical protein
MITADRPARGGSLTGSLPALQHDHRASSRLRFEHTYESNLAKHSNAHWVIPIPFMIAPRAFRNAERFYQLLCHLRVRVALCFVGMLQNELRRALTPIASISSRHRVR